MKVKIEIDTKTFVRFWLVIFAFALGVLAIYSARTALIIIGISFFLALALNAPVTQLAKRLPGKSRVGGTALAFILVVVLLGGFTFMVVPPVVEQTMKFADTVPGIVSDLSERSDGIKTFVEKYHLEKSIDDAVQSAQDSASTWATALGKNLISGISSVFSAIVSAFLVLVLSFLMLVEGPEWLKRIWATYRDKSRMKHHRDVAQRMYGVVTGYVTGQLAVSAIGGLLAGFAVFVISLFLNVPANLALPTVAICFTLSLIPMFGATIAGVIVSLLLLFNDPIAGIIFAVYFIVYQQIENNFISPFIQGKTVKLSALIVLVSVTIGLYVFGLAGGIISIPIAGCIKVLLEDYLQHRAPLKSTAKKDPVTRLVNKIRSSSSAENEA